MKNTMNRITAIIVYFFTPENSENYVCRSDLSFTIDRDSIGLGTAKALFWVMNAAILCTLISLM